MEYTVTKSDPGRMSEPITVGFSSHELRKTKKIPDSKRVKALMEENLRDAFLQADTKL